MADGPVLVIDTSYGLTVGVLGHEPLYEADSRSHVERISPLMDQALAQAGCTAADVRAVVVGVGPAPFTGLRAGIVSAKAFAFATGARLVGQDVLEPQARWEAERLADSGFRGDRLVLAVNDARRKQLYYQLFAVRVAEEEQSCTYEALSDMDIQYPVQIVDALAEQLRQRPGWSVSIVGHGAQKYFGDQSGLGRVVGTATIEDSSVVQAGARGLAIFAAKALAASQAAAAVGQAIAVNPLYLRRPDVSLPAPLKTVLSAAGSGAAGSDSVESVGSAPTAQPPAVSSQGTAQSVGTSQSVGAAGLAGPVPPAGSERA